MRIVPARDGGICRVRLAGGEITAVQAKVLSESSSLFASGVIDATNRSNLQLRGVRDDAQPALIERLVGAALGPEHEDTDDLRNVMLSPLAGIDSHALMDVTPIARDVIAMMQREPRFRALSPKFAVQIDGGERLAMLGHSHDAWLSAISADRFAFGLAGCPPVSASDDPALGTIASSDAVSWVRAMLHAFLDAVVPGHTRMRDVVSNGTLQRAFMERLSMAIDIDALPEVAAWRRRPGDPLLRFGVLEQNDPNLRIIGAQLPLGRLSADTLAALADLAPRLRFTPWQSVMLVDVPTHRAQTVLEHIATLGLIVDPALPLARVIACAGSQGCLKSLADTKSDAEHLAHLMPFSTDVHLTGCARSCAAAHPVAHTMLATSPGHYDLYRGDKTHPVGQSMTIEQAAACIAGSVDD